MEIIRYARSDQGIRGRLRMEGFKCHVLELPWRDNKNSISCIPAGGYAIQFVKTGRPFSGSTHSYWLNPVPGRQSILIHSGTFAGDRSMGFVAHSYGCILLGMSIGTYKGQAAIFRSREAIQQFHEVMQGRPAMLTIQEVYHA